MATNETELFDAVQDDLRIAEHKARIDKEQAERAAREWPHLDRLVIELNALEANCAMRNGHSLLVCGVDCKWILDFKEEMQSTGRLWQYRPTGKWRLTVGDFGNRKSFKQKGDGTFSYDKIAERVYSYAKDQQAIKVREQRKQRNSDVVQQFRYENNLTDYGCISASADVNKPIRFNKNLDLSLTEEQAAKLIATLREIGVNVY